MVFLVVDSCDLHSYLFLFCYDRWSMLSTIFSSWKDVLCCWNGVLLPRMCYYVLFLEFRRMAHYHQWVRRMVCCHQGYTIACSSCLSHRHSVLIAAFVLRHSSLCASDTLLITHALRGSCATSSSWNYENLERTFSWLCSQWTCEEWCSGRIDLCYWSYDGIGSYRIVIIFEIL